MALYGNLRKRWDAIQTRCCDATSDAYINYGGRGIRCLFASCSEFVAHVTSLPGFDLNKTIDRIDNNSHYMIGNLRWATQAEQMRNNSKTVIMEYGNERLSLKDFVAKYCHISYNHACLLVREGASAQDLVGMPPGQKRGKMARLRFDELRTKQ